jgi:hypothetical protein
MSCARGRVSDAVCRGPAHQTPRRACGRSIRGSITRPWYLQSARPSHWCKVQRLQRSQRVRKWHDRERCSHHHFGVNDMPACRLQVRAPDTLKTGLLNRAECTITSSPSTTRASPCCPRIEGQKVQGRCAPVRVTHDDGPFLTVLKKHGRGLHQHVHPVGRILSECSLRACRSCSTWRPCSPQCPCRGCSRTNTSAFVHAITLNALGIPALSLRYAKRAKECHVLQLVREAEASNPLVPVIIVDLVNHRSLPIVLWFTSASL